MTMTVALSGSAEVETPRERAVRRVEELKRAVGGVLEVLAAIYRDEDWRYLHDDTGAPFAGFGQFVQYTLGGSASNARRYRQGVETLVVPLRDLTAPDTRIPVTPNDIAQLGQSGARRVVAAAPDVLDGISDSRAQTAALRELIDEVIAERHSPTSTDGAVSSDDESSMLPAIPAALPRAPAGDVAAAGDYCRDMASDSMGADPLSRAVDAVTGRDDRPDMAAGPATDCQKLARAQSMMIARATISGADLQAVLSTVLSVDPVTAADGVDAANSAQTARDCLAAAQRLARLGQLLKALHEAQPAKQTLIRTLSGTDSSGAVPTS
ncbi:hypothetical protein H7I87_13325 [Mycobacterium timonense]|uniref:ESX-1 secretion-associated protein EspA/EspE-like domain-containing protein n=4 Tax=Mycobacterium TaxID=1763 RepID=A0ABX3S696_MYCBC|nr:hypothetical protein [Mycobacterium timonense]ORA40566.1 hypothetical protein BST19_27810 [Mycobacterium bouchedurhonense]